LSVLKFATNQDRIPDYSAYPLADPYVPLQEGSGSSG